MIPSKTSSILLPWPMSPSAEHPYLFLKLPCLVLLLGTACPVFFAQRFPTLFFVGPPTPKTGVFRVYRHLLHLLSDFRTFSERPSSFLPTNPEKSIAKWQSSVIMPPPESRHILKCVNTASRVSAYVSFTSLPHSHHFAPPMIGYSVQHTYLNHTTCG